MEWVLFLWPRLIGYPELAEEFKLTISGKLPENYKDEFYRQTQKHLASHIPISILMIMA